MSFVDLGVGVYLILSGWQGYRSGLLSRLVGLACIAPGLIIALRILPRVLNRTAESLSLNNPFGVSVGVLLAGAYGGYLVGRLIGLAFRRFLPSSIRLADKLAGMLAMAAVAGAVFWLLLPAMEVTPGWLSDQTERSALARLANNLLPDQPDVLSSLRQVVSRLQ